MAGGTISGDLASGLWPGDRPRAPRQALPGILREDVAGPLGMTKQLSHRHAGSVQPLSLSLLIHELAAAATAIGCTTSASTTRTRRRRTPGRSSGAGPNASAR